MDEQQRDDYRTVNMNNNSGPEHREICRGALLNLVDHRSERVSRNELANEISSLYRTNWRIAHHLIEEALLAEELVPAGDGQVCLNPILFGQTWAEWGERQ